MALPHSARFHAVTAPATAANWWLLRVACQLRAVNARKSRSRKIRDGALDSTAGLGAALARRFPFFDPPPCARPAAVSLLGARRAMTLQHRGIRKLKAPMTRAVSCKRSGTFLHPRSLAMNVWIGVSSAIVLEK